MTLTLTDLFCGAGGSSTGATMLGDAIDVRLAANHWDKAIETHSHNHPDSDHLQADISVTDPRYVAQTDLLWASPECFTAGHLVTTARGQIPIEDVMVGDLALTHRGRWRKVVRTQYRNNVTVVRVIGQGHVGIVTTPNHRFWARASELAWGLAPRGGYGRRYNTSDWMRADRLIANEAFWATPVSVDLVRFDPSGHGLPPVFENSPIGWELLGRWVGDGSLTFGRNHEVNICAGYHEADELEARLATTGVRWHRSDKRTAAVFTSACMDSRDWLAKEFGHGAENKQFPVWVLTLSERTRKALLAGYVTADGSVTDRRTRVSTVSKALAVSTRLLAESLGHRVAMAKDKRTSYRIEGRTGVAKQQWVLHWENTLDPARSPEAFAEGDHSWARVRKVEKLSTTATVYNIEVEEDHSYVLDGIVVANCTNHSRAKGKRLEAQQPDLFGETMAEQAAERSRATMWDVARFSEAHNYRAVFVENVVEVTQWVMFDAWLAAMKALDYEHEIISLNSMHAQYLGAPAPQSRDRVYIVFWKRGEKKPQFHQKLRPIAWCVGCETHVRAMQVWKPNRKIGRYNQQYVYRCPHFSCRNSVVEPYWLPAGSIIDWSLPGLRIGDREKPLSPNTMRRIQAGIDRYWKHTQEPMHVEMVNGYDAADPKHPQHGDPEAYYRIWAGADPLRTLSTMESKGWVIPPLAVPVEGRDGKTPKPATDPLRTATTRNETAFAFPPFFAELRGGGSDAREAARPLSTVTASGRHHALITSYYGNNTGAKPATEALDTVTTNERHALVTDGQTIDIQDVHFRMLEPDEYKLAMAFPGEYALLGNRREQVRMAGNAVTPPAARDIIGITLEAIYGEAI